MAQHRTGIPLSALAPLLALGLLLPVAPADAARTLDIQRFRPPAGPGRLIAEDSPEVLEHLGFSGGLLFGYAGTPLTFDSSGRGRYDVVDEQLGVDLALALGLWGRTELGLVLPMTLVMSGEVPPPGEAGGLPAGEGAGLGDLRVSAKVALLQGRGPLSLSLLARAALPTGDEANYKGDGGLGGTFAASAALDFGRLGLVGNLGYRLRGAEPLPGTIVGDELVFGGGGLARLVPDLLDLRAELGGATGVGSDSFGGTSETVLESRVAAAVTPHSSLQLMAGGGVPLLKGVGTPAWRVFAGVTWSPRDFDRDRDGLADAQDRCPQQTEDQDGFQDRDGCPDPDNDADGLADGVDRCPQEAEDKDGFQDEDGCPDEDNDGDGVSDLDDGCPDRPEDVDGFQDDDGCPDEDNDGDGLLDAKDNCPFEAEDLDTRQDEDGCPDPDDDNDGVPDALDRCPLAPETWNGKQDEDGCGDEELGKSALVVEATRLRLTPGIGFARGEAELRKEHYPLLDQLASLLKHHQGLLRLRLEGWADPADGTDDRQRSIVAEARAQTVLAYLLDADVDPGKLEAADGAALPAKSLPRLPGEQLGLHLVETTRR